MSDRGQDADRVEPTEDGLSPKRVRVGFTAVLAAVSTLGGLVTASDVWTRLTSKFGAVEEFKLYIWVTYFVTALAVSAAAALLAWAAARESAREASARARDAEASAREAASKEREMKAVHDRQRVADMSRLLTQMQHAIAHIVRRYAVVGDVHGLAALNRDAELRQLLGMTLMEYLQLRIGRRDISVTVKYFQASETPGAPLELKAVFRHVFDQNMRHSRPATMKSDESVIHDRFRRNERTLQFVLVPDTDALAVNDVELGDTARRNRDYIAYARKCGFRTVLAFPLREPIPLEADGAKSPSLRLNGLRGFLSFDCLAPGAFDTLFEGRSADDRTEINLVPTPDVQFFFGLADCLATLAMLVDADSSGGAEERGAQGLST